MKKPIKIQKEVFEKVLRKMLSTQPAPRSEMPKSRKKLRQIVDPATMR